GERRSQLTLRTCFLTALVAARLLAAAPQPRQPFHRPLTFEQNQGQASAQVKWLAHSSGYEMLLASDGEAIVMADRGDQQIHAPLPGTLPPLQLNYSAIRMKLAGGRPWNDGPITFALNGSTTFQTAVQASNVPQPATFLMLLPAMAALGILAR